MFFKRQTMDRWVRLILAVGLLSMLIITWRTGVAARIESWHAQAAAQIMDTQSLAISFKEPEDKGGVIHGQAPLQVAAYGRTYSYNFEGTVQCTEREWIWGDGTTDKLSCVGSGEEASLAKHTYATPGIYYPRLKVSGWRGDDVTTYSRVVAVEGAHRGATENSFAYWGLWTIVILSAVAGWIVLGRWTRHTGKRNLGMWLGRALIAFLLW